MGWSLSGPLSHSRSRTATPLGLVYTNSVMTGARRNDVFPEVMAEALAGLRPAQPAALDHQDCSSLYSRQRSGLSLWSLLRSFPTEQEPHKVPECLLFFGFCARRRMDLVLQGLDDARACGGGLFAGTEFAHLTQLLLAMFRARDEFDRAFAVIPVVHRD